MKEADPEKILDVLERPAYVETLLCAISGRNYASSIAKHLGKKQPTVTEQLKEMEKEGLLRYRKRGKSQEYDVNLDVLVEVFYDVVEKTIDKSREFWPKKNMRDIERMEVQSLVPPILLKHFLKEYSPLAGKFGIKRKGFDEIIFSFFGALKSLSLEHKKFHGLVYEFGIDFVGLRDLAELMSFQVIGLEQMALQRYMDSHNGVDMK